MIRVFGILTLAVWLFGAGGCAGGSKEERQIWEQVNITDLAPAVKDEERPKAKFFDTVHVAVHVVELPAQNVDQLDGLWNVLSAKSVYMSSYNAFSANSFRVKFGRIEMWEQIETLLAQAAAQKTATTSVPIADNDTGDLFITDLPANRMISFVGNDLSSQTVSVGPGALVLRLRAEPIPWIRGVRKIIAYPTYAPPTASAIPQLSLMARKREFHFAPAAFAAQMSPGDLVVLGPDSYTGEMVTLGGLFFNNPQGRLFFHPDKPDPPEYKPAVRVYILICMGITD
jgi:hypothetical protein